MLQTKPLAGIRRASCRLYVGWMMSDTDQDELLEIYKLHTELADRVSQRREGANRLYVSLLVGLAVFSAALLRFGIGEAPLQPMLIFIGFIGICLSISWLIVINSYRQLNSAKFRVLHDLEKKLPYQFFTLEWDPSQASEKSNRYWRLTVVEQSLPSIFLLLFVGLVVYAFLCV